MNAPRSDSEVSQDQKAQDQKRDGAHSPGKPDPWNQPLYHDWEDDSSNRCTRRDDSKRRRAALDKPRADGTGTRVEYCAHANGAADRLREEKLIVFRAERGHHEAEDVHQGSCEQDVAGAKCVEEVAEDDAAEEHQG